MGLLDNLYKENYKYIRALDALDMLAKDERCDVSKIAEFLLTYEYHKYAETYKKNYINQIEPCDDKAVGFISVDYWAVTKDILDKALENFKYSGNTFSEMYEESDYALYFWLKEDFYNFEGFKKVSFDINDDTYEKYQTSKKLAEYENNAFTEKKNKTSELNYTFYLFKKPLLSIHEAACIISGDEPNTVSRCENDTYFDQNFNDYLHAFNLIESAVMAKTLAKDELQFYGIKISDFKKYLLLEGICIDGFNDNLLVQEPIGCGQPSIQQVEPNIENLNGEIVRLRNLLADQTTEIQDLKSKIQELETHPTIQDDNPDILALILDETQTDRYAPDLVYSIKLWLDVYVNNPKADSHNNKANTWIKNNTPYNGEQDDTPTRRIREIATPFRDLHQSRKRLLENK